MDKKNISVAICGESYWAGVIKDQLAEKGIGADIIQKYPSNLFKRVWWILLFIFVFSKKYNVLHVVGVDKKLRFPKFVHNSRVAIVWNWIGSDVLKLYKMSSAEKQKYLSQCNGLRSVRIADSDKLVKELSDFGIESRTYTIIPDAAKPDLLDWPENPAVLSYWTSENSVFHNADLYYRIASCFPDTIFYVVGCDKPGQVIPKNVVFMGKLKSLKPVFQKCGVYIRQVPHDGTSMMIVEALAKGRYVIYNHDFPCCEYALKFEDIRDKLGLLLHAKTHNVSGYNWIKENMNVEKNVDKLINIYCQAITS